MTVSCPVSLAAEVTLSTAAVVTALLWALSLILICENQRAVTGWLSILQMVFLLVLPIDAFNLDTALAPLRPASYTVARRMSLFKPQIDHGIHSAQSLPEIKSKHSDNDVRIFIFPLAYSSHTVPHVSFRAPVAVLTPLHSALASVTPSSFTGELEPLHFSFLCL